MSRDLKIKVGVEIDSTKTKMQLESALSSLQKNKFKIGFDIDTKSLNTLKQTLEGFKNIKLGISTKEVGNATKNVSTSIKESNKSLNEQKQIYSQLSKLQNEEYSILKKSVGASGEYKATLDSQLQKVREKQTLLTSQLSTSEKGLQSEQKSLQLAEQKLRKERELEQVKSKNKDAMQKEVDNALKNINTKNLSTKQVEEYRRQLEGINQVNMSQVKSQIQAINKEFDSQRNKLSDIAKMSNELGGIFSTVGEGLLKAFAAPAAGLAYSTKVVMDFGQGMANVSAISGATGADLQALEDKAKELGRTTVWSAVESTDALKYMGMAGWNSTEMLDGLPTVLNLATAAGEDLGRTSDILTDALTAFGLKASDSAMFADVLAVASARSNTNVSMLGESFKMAAPIAGALSYSVQDVALALGLMANSGIKSGMAGRSLRQIMSGLNGGIELVTKSTKAWRIESANADGSTRSLKALLDDLRVAFADMTDEQKAMNAEAIAGKTGMAGLLAVVTASEEDYNNLAAAISNAEGATDDMAETMRDTLKSDMILAKSAAEGLALSFGEVLEPAARAVVQGITSVLDKFNAMSDSTKGALITITSLGVGIGATFTTLGAASKGFGALVKSYNAGLRIFGLTGKKVTEEVSEVAEETSKAGKKVKEMGDTVKQGTTVTKQAATENDKLSKSTKKTATETDKLSKSTDKATTANNKVAKSSGEAAKSFTLMKSAAVIGGIALVALIAYAATADSRLKELNKSLIDGIKQSGENIKTHTSDIESAKSKMAEIETLQKQLDNTKDKESRIQLEKDLVAKKQELIEIMPEVAEGMKAEEVSQKDLTQALGEYMDLKEREIELEKRKQSSQAREFIRENKMTGKKADSTLYSASVADKNIKVMEEQLKQIEHLQDETVIRLGSGQETTVKNYRDNINARLVDYGKQYQEQYDLALQAYEAYSALDPNTLTKDQKEYMKNFKNMKEYTKDIKDSVSKVPELKIDVGSAKSSKKAIQELIRDVKETTKNFETLPKAVKGSMKTLVNKVEDGTLTVEDFKSSMVEFEHASKQSFGKNEKAAKKSMDKLLDSFSKGELTVKEFNKAMKSTSKLNEFNMNNMSKSAQKGLGKLVERFNNSEIPVKDFSRTIESMSKLGSMNIESFSDASKNALDKVTEDFLNNQITLDDFESKINEVSTFASIDMSNMSNAIKTHMNTAVADFLSGEITVEDFKSKLDTLSIAASIDMSNLSSGTSTAINNMTLKFLEGKMSADDFQRGISLASTLTKTNLQGLSQEQQSTIGSLIEQFNSSKITASEFQEGVVSALSGVQVKEGELQGVHAENMGLFVGDVLKAKGSAEELQTAINNLKSKEIRITTINEVKNITTNSSSSSSKPASKPKPSNKPSEQSINEVKPTRNLDKNQILSRSSDGENSNTLATRDNVQTTRTSSADGKAPATSGSTTPVEIVEEVNIKTTRAKSNDDAEREREEAARKKEEMESNAISKIQDLRNKLAEALRKKIEEQKKHELKVLDEKLKAIEDNYNKQKKLAEDATNAKIEALNKEKEALNEEREEDYQAKVDALKKEKGMWEQNDSALAKSKIKELNEKIKEAEKELRNKQIEDEIEALEKAQEEKEKQLEEEYNANVEAIEKEKEAKEEWYEKQLDDQNIYSEANKLLLSGNMNSMLELLRDYAPEWENIGILFGEAMTDGLMRAIRDAISGKQFMDGLKSSFEESKPSWETAKAPGSVSNSNSSGSGSSNGSGKKGKVVGTSTLNVREGAGTNYKKSGILYKNEEIDILDEKNGWFYIEYYNAAEKQRKKGWSASNYIQRFNTGGLVGELGSLGGLAIVDSKERILTAQQTGAFDNFVYDWLPKIENIMSKFNNLKESSSIDSSSQVLNFYNTYNVDATSDFKVDKLASDVVKHIENKVRRSGVTLKPTARVFVRNN